jgi:hypothetical protein
MQPMTQDPRSERAQHCHWRSATGLATRHSDATVVPGVPSQSHVARLRISRRLHLLTIEDGVGGPAVIFVVASYNSCCHGLVGGNVAWRRAAFALQPAALAGRTGYSAAAMVPWVAAARRLGEESDAASGSGAAGSSTWVEVVVERVEEAVPETPEGKAMAGGVVVLLVVVIAYVMHRTVTASCARESCCLERRQVLPSGAMTAAQSLRTRMTRARVCTPAGWRCG